jgi:hypothetical protein
VTKPVSLLSFTLMALAVLVGCASHTPSPMPVADALSMRFSASEAGIVVRVEPYDDPEEAGGGLR